MEAAEYERMYALEDTYWWFQGRKQIITSCLETHDLLRPGLRVLDVGCGTGLMLQRLADLDPMGLDFSSLSMRYCRLRGAKRLLQADVARLPLQDSSLDLILGLDLLEHVERDDLLVDQFQRVLKPGGHVLITVPAHQDLWSEHDEALHHFRRYSANQFRRLLTERGFTLVKFSFAISATYLPIVAFRRLQRWLHRNANNRKPKTHLIVLPRLINQALIRVLHAEAWWLRNHDIPFGITLLALARKEP
jgi:ubiquinone/menaquinone biosynthesis C-methylase UbiE